MEEELCLMDSDTKNSIHRETKYFQTLTRRSRNVLTIARRGCQRRLTVHALVRMLFSKHVATGIAAQRPPTPLLLGQAWACVTCGLGPDQEVRLGTLGHVSAPDPALAKGQVWVRWGTWKLPTLPWQSGRHLGQLNWSWRSG
jgi:hypothetical protein